MGQLQGGELWRLPGSVTEGVTGSGMFLNLGLWDRRGERGRPVARALPLPSFLGGPRGDRAITEEGLQVDKDKLA